MPTTGAQTSFITVRVPGPLTREYTVMNQTLPPVPAKHRASKEFKTFTPCMIAKSRIFPSRGWQEAINHKDLVTPAPPGPDTQAMEPW